MIYMKETTQNKILKLFKTEEDLDIIASRLHSISDIINECEFDETLDIVHTKILEAIDWYARYCDQNGHLTWQSGEDKC